MGRPQIGTRGVPWGERHAVMFDLLVREHGRGTGPTVRTRNKYDRKRIALETGVQHAYIERLSWHETNPTTGAWGTRETSSLAKVLLVLGWSVTDFLFAADEYAVIAHKLEQETLEAQVAFKQLTLTLSGESG